MSNRPDYSEPELLLLLAGLLERQNASTLSPDETGASYWAGATDSTVINWDWFGNPKKAWLDDVRFRDWLAQELMTKTTATESDFVTLPAAPAWNRDIYASKITPEMAANLTGSNLEHIQVLTGMKRDDKGQQATPILRGFVTALTLGANLHDANGVKSIVLGAGLRRQTWVYHQANPSDALQIDFEMYIPFRAVAAGGDQDGHPVPIPERERVIQLGMVLSRRGKALTLSEELSEESIAGLRLNAYVAFNSGSAAGGMGQPVYNFEQKLLSGSEWEKIESTEKLQEWGNFILQTKEEQLYPELLGAPLGPVTVQEVGDDMSGIFERLEKANKTRRQELKQAKKVVKQVRAEGLKADTGLKPVVNKTKTGSEARTVGDFLVSTGLIAYLSAAGGSKIDDVSSGYKVSPGPINFWKLLQGMLEGLNGFPLWTLGVPAANGQEDSKSTGSEAKKGSEESDAKKGSASDKKEDDSAGSEKIAAPPPLGIAGQLAQARDETKAAGGGLEQRNFFGLRVLAYNILLRRAQEVAQGQRSIEVLAHMGRWFSGESTDDNWVRRLMPGRLVVQPGLAVYPLAMETVEGDESTVTFKQEWRFDMTSFGLDINGKTDVGLISAGNANRFRVKGVELRGLLTLNFPEGGGPPEVIWAIGAKINGIRLSLAPQSGQDKPTGPKAQLLSSTQQATSGSENSGQAKETEAAPLKPSTGLDYTKDEKEADAQGFSISAGYLHGLPQDGRSPFDIQLYNAEGKRGEIIYIPIDRSFGPVYLKRIGFQLRKVEYQTPELSILVTGGLRASDIEMGFIDSGVSIPLKDPKQVRPIINGVDFSLTEGQARMSGRLLLRRGFVYQADGSPLQDQQGNAVTVEQLAGNLSLQLPSFSLAVMAAYGQMSDGTVTFFAYGELGLGQGIGGATFKLKAVALGFGINRQVVIPRVDEVAEFPLVKLVMGEGEPGLPEEKDKTKDKAEEEEKPTPGAVMAKLNNPAIDALRPQKGQYFGAVGMRFLLFEVLDCFALLVAQGGNGLEISLLGLARAKQPEKPKPVVYVEVNLLVDIKPSEGVFRLEMRLGDASWILNPSCQLTGGLALVTWYGGSHKGDFVLTIGGYHPRFARPAYYPVVPQLGFNWQVTSKLNFKGGMYFAITNSAFMVGGRFEGSFHSGPLSASLLVYLDILVQWKPLHYDLAAGIVLHARISLWLFHVSVTLSLELLVQGPPVHGKVHVKYGPLKKTISFGDKSKKPLYVQEWAEFGRAFLDSTKQDGSKADADDGSATGKWQLPAGGADTDLQWNTGPNILHLNIARGVITSPGSAEAAKKNEVDQKPADTTPLVRGDELTINLATVIPVSQAAIGNLVSPEKLPDSSEMGKSLTISQSLSLENQDDPAYKGSTVGIRPMGVWDSFSSQLNIALVTDAGEIPENPITTWSHTDDRQGMPVAIWGSKPFDDKEVPDAKMIADCLVGIKNMRPPQGASRGSEIRGIKKVNLGWDWNQAEDRNAVRDSYQSPAPDASQTRADVSALIDQKQPERQKMVAALSAAGFAEAEEFNDDAGPFRPFNARPMMARKTEKSL